METTTSLGFDAVKLSGECKTCSTNCYPEEWLQVVQQHSPHGFVAEYQGQLTYLTPTLGMGQSAFGTRHSRYHTQFLVDRVDNLVANRIDGLSTPTHTATHDQFGNPIPGTSRQPINLVCKVYNHINQVFRQVETHFIGGLTERLELFPVCGNLEIQDSGSQMLQWWGGGTDIYGGFSEHRAFLMLIKNVCKNKESRITSAYPLKSSSVEEVKKVGLLRKIYDRTLGSVTKTTTCIQPCDKYFAGCSNGTETVYEAKSSTRANFGQYGQSLGKFNTWQDAYDAVVYHDKTRNLMVTYGAHNLGGIEWDAFMPVSPCEFRMHMYGQSRKYGTGVNTIQPFMGAWRGFGEYGPWAANYKDKDGWTKTTSGREAFGKYSGRFPIGPQTGPDTDINLNGWVLSTANDSYDFKTFQRIQGPPYHPSRYAKWEGVEFGNDISYMRHHTSGCCDTGYDMRAMAYYQAHLTYDGDGALTAAPAPYPLQFNSLWERSWPASYDAATGNPETPDLVIPPLIDITLQ